MVSKSNAKKKKTSVIAISNQKGGVGKTATVVNLAMAFSLLDYKVLVADFDWQGDASDWFGVKDLAKKLNRHIRSAVENELKFNDIVFKTKFKNIDIIANEPNFNFTMRRLNGTKKQFKVVEKVLECSHLYNYDIVIIDTHPSLDALMDSVLAYSHYVLIPTVPEPHPYEGVATLMHVINETKKDDNPNLFILGLLISNFDGSATHKKYKIKLLEDQKRTNLAVLETDISHVKDMKGAAAAKTPLAEYKKTVGAKKVSQEFTSIVEELAKFLKGKRIGRPQPMISPEMLDVLGKSEPKSIENDFGAIEV